MLLKPCSVQSTCVLGSFMQQVKYVWGVELVVDQGTQDSKLQSLTMRQLSNIRDHDKVITY